MGQTLLLSGHIEDMDTLNALLNNYREALFKSHNVPADTDVFMLMEQQPQAPIPATELYNMLRFNLFHSKTDFTSYTSGRVFHEYGELRWEKQGNSVLLIYTGDDQSKPTIQATETLLLDSDPIFKRYFLFGRRLDERQLQRMGLPAQDNVFAEVRIPRLLRYPVPQDATRVQIVACEYNDHATGACVASRFASLVGVQ
jgi:hypothetical protein